MTDLESKRPTGYFKIHYTIFRLLGLGLWHSPQNGDTRNFTGWYLYYAIITELICVAGFVGLESIDPFFGDKDLDRFMFSLSFVITHDLTIVKLYSFFFKNSAIQEIVRILEVDLYRYYQNNLKNSRTIRTTKIMTGAFVFFGWITILNANIFCIIQDMRWKTDFLHINDSLEKPPRTLPVPVYIPWNYQSELSYFLAFGIVNLGLLWTGHIVLTLDTFIGSLILHMSSQFSILQEAIETAYDRTMAQLAKNATEDILEIDGNMSIFNDTVVQRNFSKEEVENALEKAFTNCFRQHQLLISCVDKFARTYSYGFMTQLVSSVSAICVIMVQVSHDASTLKSISLLTSLAFFMAMIVQLALQCFTSNELTFQAGRVAESVMLCKWELLPVRLQRGLMLMMMRAQRPLRLSAAGFAYIDNDCFLAILKAAYSYYAVLSQTQN